MTLLFKEALQRRLSKSHFSPEKAHSESCYSDEVALLLIWEGSDTKDTMKYSLRPPQDTMILCCRTHRLT